MKTSDLYQHVTNSIIKTLEEGTAVWIRPWKTSRVSKGSIMPHNFATGRPYSGINVPILWCRAADNGYAEHSWLTYQQATLAGGQVRKGEKSCTVVFTKKLAFKEEDDTERKVSMLRQFYVFNVAQIDGLKEPEIQSELPEAREANTETFIQKTAAQIKHGGNGDATKLSEYEIESLRARLMALWTPPSGLEADRNTQIIIRINLKLDGTLASGPQVLTSGSGLQFSALRDSAVRAVLVGQPYTMLRPDHYEGWKEIDFLSDTKNLWSIRKP